MKLNKISKKKKEKKKKRTWKHQTTTTTIPYWKTGIGTKILHKNPSSVFGLDSNVINSPNLKPNITWTLESSSSKEIGKRFRLWSTFKTEPINHFQFLDKIVMLVTVICRPNILPICCVFPVAAKRFTGTHLSFSCSNCWH